MTAVPQWRKALDRANAVRMARAEAKRRLARGDLTLREALEHPMLERMRVLDLVTALPRYGPFLASRLLAQARISPAARVGALSAARRNALCSALEADRAG